MQVTYKTIPVQLLDTESQRLIHANINQIMDGEEDFDRLEDLADWVHYDHTIFYTLNAEDKIKEGLALDDGYYIVSFASDEHCTEYTFSYADEL